MAFQRPGGGEQILTKTYLELKKRGIKVELFDPWSTKIEDFDIVHHFSLLEWKKFKDYKDLDTKVVVTPTTWPAVDFKTMAKEKIKNVFFKQINPTRPLASLSHYQNYVDLFLPTTAKEQLLIEKRYSIPADKCRVIPNGVTPPKKVPLENNQFYKEHKIEAPIVFSGSIRPNKNIDLLIRACIQKKSPLIIMGQVSAGHEDYEKKCHELAASASIPIIWTGYIEQETQTYNEIYSLAGCVCIPSKFETFCLAAAQASAIGKPIVIPFEGGTTEVFGNYATYLKEYSVEAMAQAIEKAQNISAKKLNTLESRIQNEYSWDNIINKLIGIYNEL